MNEYAIWWGLERPKPPLLEEYERIVDEGVAALRAQIARQFLGEDPLSSQFYAGNPFPHLAGKTATIPLYAG